MSRGILQPETAAARALMISVTALMVGLGMLALAVGVTLRHVETRWRTALADRWTVELPATSPGATDASQLIPALSRIPGVRAARVMDPAETRHLLTPWLGEGTNLNDLPLPTLVDLTVDPAAPPSRGNVQSAIAAVPGAQLDDHAAWTDDIVRLADVGETIGLALFALILLAAMLAIIAAARARLSVNRAEIALLHELGANDRYIAGQFQASAFRSAVIGTVLGLVLASAAIFGLGWLGGLSARFLPALALEPADWIALICLPAVAIALATLAAGMTATALVRRMP